MQFGKRMAELRKARNITQKDVADALGVSPAQVSKYENGIDTLSCDKVMILCRLFRITPNDFFQKHLVMGDMHTIDPMKKRDIETLISYFVGLDNAKVRKLIINMTRESVNINV